MIYIGIDPGKKGAIAWMNEERTRVEIHDVPLLADGDYDLFGMYKLLRAACWAGPLETRVTIEDTISIPHAAEGQRFLPASDKMLHFNLGAWCALAAALQLPVRLVAPRTWKRTMLAGVPNDPKAEARALVHRFRGVVAMDHLLGPRGGLRDGRTDAVWLAEYGRVTHRLSTGRA